MIKVVIVGDKPSSRNLHEDIPFVGADCFKRLAQWIKRLEVDYYITFNSETERDLVSIETLLSDDFKVIALGKFASARLKDRGIKHYTLPHPSLRNLQNNDPSFIDGHLKNAWLYLRSDYAKNGNG